jgi:nitrate reductase NapAB chaperone NapD
MSDTAQKPPAEEEILAVLANMGSTQLAAVVTMGREILQKRHLKAVMDFLAACTARNCIIPKPSMEGQLTVIIDEAEHDNILQTVRMAMDILGAAQLPYSVNISQNPGEFIEPSVLIGLDHPCVNMLDKLDDEDSLPAEDLYTLWEGAAGNS